MQHPIGHAGIASCCPTPRVSDISSSESSLDAVSAVVVVVASVVVVVKVQHGAQGRYSSESLALHSLRDSILYRPSNCKQETLQSNSA